MSTTPGSIIAVEGVHADTLASAARTLAGQRTSGGAASFWDSSGVFAELAVAAEAAGRPSVRTLLLLYASDLAYRLRTEILPALIVGQDVVAAPYLETALAFAQAGGIDSQWIADIFAFAPAPAKRFYTAAHPGSPSERPGFVEFGGRKLHTRAADAEAFIADADRQLRGLAQLTGAILL